MIMETELRVQILSMMVSIVVFMREIQVSTNALKLHMSDMDVNLD